MIVATCLLLVLGIWEDQVDYDTDASAESANTPMHSFYLVQMLSLACVAAYAADCAITKRLAASWSSDFGLVTRVALTALILADSLAYLSTVVVTGDKYPTRMFDSRILRPALLILHPGARPLRFQLVRVLSLFSATWELVLLFLILVFSFMRSFAITQAPGLPEVTPYCPPADNREILVLFCSGYTLAILVLWGLAVTAALMHGDQQTRQQQKRETERQKVVVSAAFAVLDLDKTGTISDRDFSRYAMHMAGEASVPLSEQRVRHIWSTVVSEYGYSCTTATCQQFEALTSALLLEIVDYPPMWCAAHAECVVPRVPEPCLERIKECDVLAPAIGGDLTGAFKPEGVVVKRFQHVWQPSRKVIADGRPVNESFDKKKTEKPATVAPSAAPMAPAVPPEATPAEKKPMPMPKPKPKPKWQAAQDVLDRGKPAADSSSRADGVHRELFYRTVPGLVNPILEWQPIDDIIDPKTAKPKPPYMQVQNHGVVISRTLVFKNFSADEFSDPASRLLDVWSEHGPSEPKTNSARLMVGGLMPRKLRPVVIFLWQFCVGECVALLALLLPPVGEDSHAGIVVAKLFCCLALVAECVVTVLAVGCSGYWHTVLHRRNGFTTICFVISLALDFGHGRDEEQPSVLSAVATLAHMLFASRVLWLIRLLRPRRMEGAVASHMRVVSAVVAQCHTALIAHTVLLLLLIYGYAAARLSFSDDTNGVNTTAAADITMADRFVSVGVIVLGGGGGALDLLDGSASHAFLLLLLLWATHVLLLGSAAASIFACWRFESQRHRCGHDSSALNFEQQNKLTVDDLDSRAVLRQFNDQMMPLRQRLKRGCNQWFKLLLAPHEWPFKAKLVEDRICECCLMRQRTCGPLDPVFMPLRRRRGGGPIGAEGAEACDVIPAANEPAGTSIHVNCNERDGDDGVRLASLGGTTAATMTGSTCRQLSQGSGQRQGFEPIWSCGACCAVYMAHELSSIDRWYREPPSEDNIGKKDQSEETKNSLGVSGKARGCSSQTRQQQQQQQQQQQEGEEEECNATLQTTAPSSRQEDALQNADGRQMNAAEDRTGRKLSE